MTLLNLAVVEYFKSVDPAFMENAEGKKVSATYPMNLRSPAFDVTKEGTSNGYLSLGIVSLRLSYDSRIELLKQMKLDIDLVRRSSFNYVVNRLIAFNEFMSRFSYSPDKARKRAKESDGRRTLLLSNNKGPPETLYLLGKEVVDFSFFSLAQTPNIFNVTSYRDILTCSISLDAAVEPDTNRLTKFWNAEFEELYNEAMKVGSL